CAVSYDHDRNGICDCRFQKLSKNINHIITSYIISTRRQTHKISEASDTQIPVPLKRPYPA
ncbi:MAG: hypothetical protein ACI8RD_011793, partial [Bacillariaceae sp.]